ncbi:MAG: NAD-dependent epimerase/dehydratase family protein, partial [Candidatus Aminicenantes bacterium]|nr:NAD-dependent epimerase/dehydratase family protein [Candidatus Aminicenantes bacterium]
VRILIHNKNIPESRDCEVFFGDIGDKKVMEDALRGVDVLFHLAAALGGSLIDKNEFFRINAAGTQNVLETAFNAGVKKVLHFSSAGVLGAVQNNEAADEDYPTNPLSAYDQSKLEGENIALDFAKKGKPVFVIRPGWVYGPGDKRTFKLIKAIARKKFILVTRGLAHQTPVFIDDLIQGVLLCVGQGRYGEIYNIAGDEVLTVRQIAENIGIATNSTIPKLTLPLFPMKAAAWKLEKIFKLFKKEAPLTRGKLAFFIHPKPLSIHKAARELGYVPQTNFQTGLIQTINWYRTEGWL